MRDSTGATVRDFDVEHDKRMHLIVVRRDLTAFEHLHPTMSNNGTWSTRLTLSNAGSYRMFADFKHNARNHTLARNANVAGRVDRVALPPAKSTATTKHGYRVRLHTTTAATAKQTTLAFSVTRGGRPAALQPYLGAQGHLVALRATDLAYLHVHPTRATRASAEAIRFTTEFPTPGHYRLFLQFKHHNRVHTTAFTTHVAP